VTSAEIAAWADGVIKNTDDPPLTVIDLALLSNGHPLDVLGKLSEISLGINSVHVLPQVLGRFAPRLRADPSLGPVVARGLYDIFVEANYRVPDELMDIVGFDDAYALAQTEAYGTADDVYRDLLAFVEGFADDV
jgi:hypothetical protein